MQRRVDAQASERERDRVYVWCLFAFTIRFKSSNTSRTAGQSLYVCVCLSQIENGMCQPILHIDGEICTRVNAGKYWADKYPKRRTEKYVLSYTYNVHVVLDWHNIYAVEKCAYIICSE